MADATRLPAAPACTSDGVVTPVSPAVPTLLNNVLFPTAEGSYSRFDVLLADGKIAFIGSALPAELDTPGLLRIDCTERLILPGFVNAHTHSVEHWVRGLIKPLPLELWVQALIRNEPRGDNGWFGADSYVQTPAEALKLSAIMGGVESLLSGCTAVIDHVFIRDLDDMAAVVEGYKAVGMRAFIAPMLGDETIRWPYHSNPKQALDPQTGPP